MEVRNITKAITFKRFKTKNKNMYVLQNKQAVSDDLGVCLLNLQAV